VKAWAGLMWLRTDKNGGSFSVWGYTKSDILISSFFFKGGFHIQNNTELISTNYLD
jgi:hypothetical protein